MSGANGCGCSELAVRRKKREQIDAAEALLGGGRRDEAVWTRGLCLAISMRGCVYCFGRGQRPGRNRESVCNCVLRRVFRACYARFRTCTSRDKHVSHVTLGAAAGRRRQSLWGLKNEEYIADFCLIARRALNEREYRVFAAHFLLGADYLQCCRRLKTDRGSFFHDVYRIQQKLGRAYAEAQPYALFPVDEYFSDPDGRKTQRRQPEAKAKVLRFPVARRREKAMAAA